MQLWVVGVAACAGLLSGTSQAEIIRYTGTGAFDSASSWSSQQVPGSSDTIGIINVSQAPALSGTATYGGLLLHGTETLVYGGADITLTGNGDTEYALQVGHATEPFGSTMETRAYLVGPGPWGALPPALIVRTPSMGVAVRSVGSTGSGFGMLGINQYSRVYLNSGGKAVIGDGAVGLLSITDDGAMIGDSSTELWIGARPGGTATGGGQVYVSGQHGMSKAYAEVGTVYMRPSAENIAEIGLGYQRTFKAHRQIDMSGLSTLFATQGLIQVGTGLPNSNFGVHVTKDGLLSGDGAIRGSLFVLDGMLSPGHSPGKIEVAGDVNLLDAAVTEMEILSATAGEYDVIKAFDNTDSSSVIEGVITLGGTLNLKFLPGYELSAGGTLKLFDGRIVQGQFGAINVSGLDPQVEYEWLADRSGIVITAVPEPAILLSLSALVCTGLAIRQRRVA